MCYFGIISIARCQKNIVKTKAVLHLRLEYFIRTSINEENIKPPLKLSLTVRGNLQLILSVLFGKLEPKITTTLHKLMI